MNGGVARVGQFSTLEMRYLKYSFVKSSLRKFCSQAHPSVTCIIVGNRDGGRQVCYLPQSEEVISSMTLSYHPIILARLISKGHQLA